MSWTYLPPGTLWSPSDVPLSGLLLPVASAFLTGDGHRDPPFQWIFSNQALYAHLLELQGQNLLCVYVEQLQRDVTHASVPRGLSLAFENRKVFGWEPQIFEDLRPLMERCTDLPTGQDAVALADDMLRVHSSLEGVAGTEDLQQLRPEIEAYRSWYQPATKTMFSVVGNYFGSRSSQPAAAAPEPDGKLWTKYYNCVMEMRIKLNPEIAQNIQSIMRSYPGHTHLITCGYAHLTEAPLLQDHIQLDEGLRGVIDTSKG